MKNVLYIIDDHNMVRNGLKSYLESHMEWKVIKDFDNSRDCLSFLEKLPAEDEIFPEILIVDVQLMGENGFQLVREISKNFPQIKCVMYSMYDTAGFILQAKDSGAKAYISKIAKEEELVHCLELVQRGQTYLEDHMIQTQNKISSIVTMLSKQEKNIFEAILQGKSNQQICDELFLSNRTVENYTSRLYSKISVKDREELIKKYSK